MFVILKFIALSEFCTYSNSKFSIEKEIQGTVITPDIRQKEISLCIGFIFTFELFS